MTLAAGASDNSPTTAHAQHLQFRFDALIAKARVRARRRRFLLAATALILSAVAIALTFAGGPSGGAGVGGATGSHSAAPATSSQRRRPVQPLLLGYQALPILSSGCRVKSFRDSLSSPPINVQTCFVAPTAPAGP